MNPALPTDIAALDIATDRTRLVVATYAGEVWRYELPGLRAPALIADGLSGVWGLAVDRSGARTVVGHALGLSVFDAESGEVLMRDVGGSTATPAISPDGTRVAGGFAGDGTLRVYDVASGTELGSVFAPDSAAAFIGETEVVNQPVQSSFVDVYAISEAGLEVARSTDTQLPGGGIAVSPDGSLVVTGGLNGDALLLRTDTLEQVGGVLEVRGSRTGAFAFSPDGSVVALSSDDGSVLVVETSRGTRVSEVTGLTGSLISVFLDDTTLLTASFSGTDRAIWSIAARAGIGDTWPVPEAWSGRTIDDGASIVLAGHGAVSVVALDDPTNVLREQAVGDQAFWLAVNEAAGIAAVYAIDVDTEADVVTERRITVVGLDDLGERTRIVMPTVEDRIETMAISNDGRRIAVGFRDGALAVYATADGSVLLEPTPVDDACCLGLLVWSGDDGLLHTGGQGGVIRTYDTTDWSLTLERTLVEEQLALRLAVIDPLTETLVVPAESGEVFLLDHETLEPLQDPLIVAGTQLQRAQFTRDGGVIAAQGRDGKLRLWDVASGRPIGPAMNGHGDFALTLEHARDGRMVSVTPAGTLIVWDLAPDAWVERACTLVGRNLTRAEWDRYIGGEYRATCSQWPADG